MGAWVTVNESWYWGLCRHLWHERLMSAFTTSGHLRRHSRDVIEQLVLGRLQTGSFRLPAFRKRTWVQNNAEKIDALALARGVRPERIKPDRLH